MLPYDICVALKEAGYPQENLGMSIYFSIRDRCGFVAVGQDITTYVKRPTLEELIESCVPKMYRLDYDDTGEDGYKACAGSADNHFTGHGKTASEAVASLWLAITK